MKQGTKDNLWLVVFMVVMLGSAGGLSLGASYVGDHVWRIPARACREGK